MKSEVDLARETLERSVSKLSERDQELFKAGSEYGQGKVLQLLDSMQRSATMDDAIGAVLDLIRLEYL